MKDLPAPLLRAGLSFSYPAIGINILSPGPAAPSAHLVFFSFEYSRVPPSWIRARLFSQRSRRPSLFTNAEALLPFPAFLPLPRPLFSVELRSSTSSFLPFLMSCHTLLCQALRGFSLAAFSQSLLKRLSSLYPRPEVGLLVSTSHYC